MHREMSVDTYHGAHVSVFCAICPSPSCVTPPNRSRSHRSHRAGCLQPLDCVREKVKEHRNKHENMLLVLVIRSDHLCNTVKKRTGRTGVWSLQCLGFSREPAAARTDSPPLSIHRSESRLMTPAIKTHTGTMITVTWLYLNQYTVKQFQLIRIASHWEKHTF